ncbi:uncharacterized protein LOC143028124 [Oratosquilla oratoria]|uniref:uncharacterized protein LOC143028124 n=1 Tax=Oratosquilla oratoria TaxID=337810 RepID=UPI003F761B8B
MWCHVWAAVAVAFKGDRKFRGGARRESGRLSDGCCGQRLDPSRYGRWSRGLSFAPQIIKGYSEGSAGSPEPHHLSPSSTSPPGRRQDSPTSLDGVESVLGSSPASQGSTPNLDAFSIHNKVTFPFHSGKVLYPPPDQVPFSLPTTRKISPTVDRHAPDAAHSLFDSLGDSLHYQQGHHNKRFPDTTLSSHEKNSESSLDSKYSLLHLDSISEIERRSKDRKEETVKEWEYKEEYIDERSAEDQLEPEDLRSSSTSQRDSSSFQKLTSPCHQASSPNRQGLSPDHQALSPNRQALSPNPQSSSPYYLSSSPCRQSLSPSRHSPSPYPRTSSPYHQSSGPYRQSSSPYRQSLRSPHQRAPSPHRRALSPHQRAHSPHQQALSSYQRALSPHHQPLSPDRQAPSPHQQSSSFLLQKNIFSFDSGPSDSNTGVGCDSSGSGDGEGEGDNGGNMSTGLALQQALAARAMALNNLVTVPMPNPLVPTLLPMQSATDSPEASSLLVRALASSAPRRPRGEKKPIPDSLKDEKYFERRKRNNLAAKKSRDARKQREDQVTLRAGYLEKENAMLRAQVATLREEAASLRHILMQKKQGQQKTYEHKFTFPSV